jgi:hypothetical protein
MTPLLEAKQVVAKAHLGDKLPLLGSDRVSCFTCLCAWVVHCHRGDDRLSLWLDGITPGCPGDLGTLREIPKQD